MSCRKCYRSEWQYCRPNTLKVESFAGINFRRDKLSRTPRAKIKFRGYKLSRLQAILPKFSYFNTIFGVFSSNISRIFMKVRFGGYKLSRSAKKIAKSRNFLPAKLSTFKVLNKKSEGINEGQEAG